MSEIDCTEHFTHNVAVDLASARTYLHNVQCEKWKLDVLNVPKLRSYIVYKQAYNTEPYVKIIHNRAHRSALAQFRSGILPLRVETGRFTSIPLEYRLCIFLRY